MKEEKYDNVIIFVAAFFKIFFVQNVDPVSGSSYHHLSYCFVCNNKNVQGGYYEKK